MAEPAPERTPPDDAESLTAPAVAGPGYAAVYEVIREWPGTAERNAVIWRAVHAYEAATAVTTPPDDTTEGLRERYAKALEPAQPFTHHLLDAMMAARDEEMERLRAELAESREAHQSAVDDAEEALRCCDAADAAQQAAETERDLLRETLAETDLGAQVLAQWEAIAAADADRDRLEAEVERLQAEMAEASDALCAVGKAALIVAPTLAKPYPDAPKTSPWEQFMERPVRDAYNLGKRIRRELKETRDAQ